MPPNPSHHSAPSNEFEIDVPLDFPNPTAGDNTGKPRTARAQQGRKTNAMRYQSELFRNAAKLQCPNCRGDTMVVLADQHPLSGLVQIGCSRPDCKTWWPPFEMRVPQMDDFRARNLGLEIADANLGELFRRQD